MSSTLDRIFAQLWLRKTIRRGKRIIFWAMIAAALLDHSGAFGYHGDDWLRFDRATVVVQHVIDGQTFDCAGTGCGGTSVRLLGIFAPTEAAAAFSRSRLEGRSVTLRLDVPQTRDANGRLLAYVFLSPSGCWNDDLIAAHLARADRRSGCSMESGFIALENAITRKTAKTASTAAHKSKS